MGRRGDSGSWIDGSIGCRGDSGSWIEGSIGWRGDSGSWIEGGIGALGVRAPGKKEGLVDEGSRDPGYRAEMVVSSSRELGLRAVVNVDSYLTLTTKQVYITEQRRHVREDFERFVFKDSEFCQRQGEGFYREVFGSRSGEKSDGGRVVRARVVSFEDDGETRR